jgi:hypothetical protein
VNAAYFSDFKSVAYCFGVVGGVVVVSVTVWGFLAIVAVAIAWVMTKKIEKDKALSAIDKLGKYLTDGQVTLTCGDLEVISKPADKPSTPLQTVQSATPAETSKADQKRRCSTRSVGKARS